MAQWHRQVKDFFVCVMEKHVPYLHIYVTFSHTVFPKNL